MTVLSLLITISYVFRVKNARQRRDGVFLHIRLVYDMTHDFEMQRTSQVIGWTSKKLTQRNPTSHDGTSNLSMQSVNRYLMEPSFLPAFSLCMVNLQHASQNLREGLSSVTPTLFGKQPIFPPQIEAFYEGQPPSA